MKKYLLCLGNQAAAEASVASLTINKVARRSVTRQPRGAVDWGSPSPDSLMHQLITQFTFVDHCFLQPQTARICFSQYSPSLPSSPMPYGLRRSNGHPLSRSERLILETVLRKSELKHIRKAIAALRSCSLVMPDATRQSIRSWRADKRLKIQLQDHLSKEAGVDRTVNPLNLRPPLE
jgi:hypothetical protein